MSVCLLPLCCWPLTLRCRFLWGCCWSCCLESLVLSPGRCYTPSLSHNTDKMKWHAKEFSVWTASLSVSVPTCQVQGAFLGGGDGAVSASQQWAAPPLADLLLQPWAQLQVGFRSWMNVEQESVRCLVKQRVLITIQYNQYLVLNIKWYSIWNLIQPAGSTSDNDRYFI